MSFWVDLKKRGVLREIISEVEPVWQKFCQMSGVGEAELNDLKEVMIREAMARKIFIRKDYSRLEMLKPLAALGEKINKHNQLSTCEELWLDIQVKLWEYQVCAEKELLRLSEFKKEARNIRADYLAERAQEELEKIEAERESFIVKVNNLKPVKHFSTRESPLKFKQEYLLLKQLLEARKSDYQRGESPLLKAQERLRAKNKEWEIVR